VGVNNPSKVGTFLNGVWELDTQGDGGAADQIFFGLPGDMPIVGDWDGSGFDEIGVVRTLTNINLPDGHHPLEFILDSDGNGTFDSGDAVLSLARAATRSYSGDWNGAGKTEVGVVRNNNNTLVWSLDYNGDFREPAVQSAIHGVLLRPGAGHANRW